MDGWQACRKGGSELQPITARRTSGNRLIGFFTQTSRASPTAWWFGAGRGEQDAGAGCTRARDAGGADSWQSRWRDREDPNEISSGANLELPRP